MNLKQFRVGRALVSFGLFTLIAGSALAQDRSEPSIVGADTTAAGNTVRVENGGFLQITIPAKKPWKKIPRNSALEGRLALPVYAGEQIALPSGTSVRLTVESVAKVNRRTGVWKKLGHGIVKAFNPLESSRAPEYDVHLAAVEAVLPDGHVLPLKTRFLRAGNGILVEPQARRRNRDSSQDGSQPVPNAAQSRPKSQQTLLLALEQEILCPVTGPADAKAFGNEHSQTVSATRARAFVLTALSASQNREGDLFQAQLAEPVVLAGQVFEAGSLLEGRVLRSRPPRMLSRAGSLSLRVDRVTSPHGGGLPVNGTLGGAESDASPRFFLDDEGRLHGIRPGLKNALVDLGISYALGKTADDIAETPIRAIGSGMSNAAVANAARYVGITASAFFLVTRHGRDVHLPKFAEIEVDFGRAEKRLF